MRNLLLVITLLFLSFVSVAQKDTITASKSNGYFQVNGIDYPKGHYTIDYYGDINDPEKRIFSLKSLYDGTQIISSRYYNNIEGVTSWDELIQLLGSVGVVAPQPSNMPYELQVSQRLIPNTEVIDKFGINPLVSTGQKEDIWEYGGIYNYDPDGTAPIIYVSSSDALDTVTISVTGLDINGYQVTQQVTLNGQNNITLTTPLWRVFRMGNESSVNIEGIVYCHTDPAPTNGVPAGVAVRAIINDGNNQTLMSLYTIPKDKIGFLYRGEVGVTYEGGAAALAEYATVQYHSRRYGKVFTVKKEFTLIVGGASIHTDKRSFPDIVPELTDIKITATEVSADMGLWATFDIILYDKSMLPPWLVSALGMSN